jgi:lysophospholipase L1-like esterase
MTKLIKMISIVMCTLLSMSYAVAEPRMQTWIILGDSIMSGVSNSTINGPDGKAKDLAANIVMNSRNISIRNLSSPGNTIGSKDHTGFGDVLATSAALNMVGGYWTAFDGIIIQAGTNDFGRDLHWAETVHSLRNIMGYSRAMHKKVMIMEPIWRFNQDQPNKKGFTLDTYRFFMYLVCVQENPDICRYADRTLSGLADANSRKYFGANEQASSLELHLNAEGQKKYAEWIMSSASKFGFF